MFTCNRRCCQVSLQYFSDTNINIKQIFYLQKLTALLWIKFFFQYIPQPIDNSVVVMETAIILSVLPLKQNKNRTMGPWLIWDFMKSAGFHLHLVVPIGEIQWISW